MTRDRGANACKDDAHGSNRWGEGKWGIHAADHELSRPGRSGCQFECGGRQPGMPRTIVIRRQSVCLGAKDR